MSTTLVSIETSAPLTMIDSEPGVRTNVAALEDVTNVGAGVEDDVFPDGPVDEPESVVEPLPGVEPESDPPPEPEPESLPSAIPEIEILKT